MTRPRLFAGDALKALRRRHQLNQAAMAARLGISVSYLSQIESGDRPLTPAVLAALAQRFPGEWTGVAPEAQEIEAIAALAAGTDPAVPQAQIDEASLLRAARQQPALARRMTALHHAWQRSQQQLSVLDDRVGSGSAAGLALPWEEVRDWFQAAGNYVDPLDRLAEAVAGELGGAPGAIEARLTGRHGIKLVEPEPRELRAFDAEARTLAIDRSQSVESQRFQLAHQLMRLEAADTIAALVAAAPLRAEAARDLLAVGLANYAAGALLMPYEAFRAAAHALRHDVDRLRQRFRVSFEQVCHRLSTLQRPGRPGTPFFFCRIDMAGNITKRHSATRLQFAQFGGTCPLWIVHEAVAIPDRILTQLAETPDGVRYVSIAKGLVKPTASWRQAPRRYAVALGCEIEHAGSFVYGDGFELGGTDAATPIGASCRICPRRDCDQRAFPPAGRELLVEPDRRALVPYSFR